MTHRSKTGERSTQPAHNINTRRLIGVFAAALLAGVLLGTQTSGALSEPPDVHHPPEIPVGYPYCDEINHDEWVLTDEKSTELEASLTVYASTYRGGDTPTVTEVTSFVINGSPEEVWVEARDCIPVQLDFKYGWWVHSTE